MSSDGIARVQVLYRKATELSNKGHLLRAAEIYSRAAEAARALDSGPDNLVTVGMQLYEAAARLNYIPAATKSAVDAHVLAAQRADSVSLLSTAVATLERRRVAGTLLEGTAVEETWNAVEWTDAHHPAAEAASRAKLVGYDTFLRAAHSILCLLINAWLFSECSATQFQAFAQCVVHAADLMQLPRCLGTPALLDEEVRFTQRLSYVMTDESGVPFLHTRGVDARLVQLLTGAWRRLQRSGVLETRGLLGEGVLLEMSTSSDKRLAALRAAMAAPGLRTCALAGCSAKEAHPQHFKRCSACKLVVYCSKEHQLEAWPAHKAACKAARKAAAAASDDCGAGSGAAS